MFFVTGLLYYEKRVSYHRLREEFKLDDDTLAGVRHELMVKRVAVEYGELGLAWAGETHAGDLAVPTSPAEATDHPSCSPAWPVRITSAALSMVASPR